MHRLEPNTSMALTVQRTVLILGAMIGAIVSVMLAVAHFERDEHVPISVSESHQQGTDKSEMVIGHQ